MKGRFIRACLNKWRKMGTKVIPCEHCCKYYWGFWASIPKDVPKGHLVVYVGQNYKRFVIKITLLQHPLFTALLDQAMDDHYDFITPSKLCIPCDESVFLDVLRRAAKCSPQSRSCFLM
ncbi:protein SMALL AUXIN UP-REGULATED RNA 12-like [Euphorbia lathyris]|uniref:protein SMALL AUXIN UP-REGULATED RNA 12-like n=1 Tax=Euphorbia lathyris TaxID=212925 RepID=UPI00331318E3